MKRRVTEEQIIGILQEAEASNAQIRTVVRRHNITETAFFRWHNKYGGMARRGPDALAAHKLYGSLRDECLNGEWCLDVLEARVIIERWSSFYNHQHPHIALGYRAPALARRAGREAVNIDVRLSA